MMWVQVSVGDYNLFLFLVHTFSHFDKKQQKLGRKLLTLRNDTFE